VKKIKGLKKVKKFGIGKFLVMALVLGGGLIYGTQMVQKNQENRSNAMKPGSACKCSNPKYGNAYNCSKNKAKWICPITIPTAKPTTKPSSGQKYYFYNGSKCVQTGSSFSTPTLCKNSVRSACYGSLPSCEGAHATPTPKPSINCSHTNCGGCASASTCAAGGCYWEVLTKVCTESSNKNPCGPSANTCKWGKVNSVENTKYYYLWNCDDKRCGLIKPDALEVDITSKCTDQKDEKVCKNGRIFKCKMSISKGYYAWEEIDECKNGCTTTAYTDSNRGAVCNSCKPGEQRCKPLSNKMLQICNERGGWTDNAIECSFGCGRGYYGDSCKECTPKDRKCASETRKNEWNEMVDTGVIKVCNDEGFWKEVEQCPNGCADGYCI